MYGNMHGCVLQIHHHCSSNSSSQLQNLILNISSQCHLNPIWQVSQCINSMLPMWSFLKLNFIPLRSVPLMGSYCVNEFGSADFSQPTRSFGTIWTEIRERIWGMDGLINPPKVWWYSYNLTEIMKLSLSFFVSHVTFCHVVILWLFTLPARFLSLHTSLNWRDSWQDSLHFNYAFLRTTPYDLKWAYR